jgi:NADH dehydrogenase
VQGDVRDYDSVEHAISGAKSVISAVNGFIGDRSTNPQTIDHKGNSNLIKAARKNAVNKFILISISGATPDHPLELFRMKYLAEKELQASGLMWTIIQATAFMETWGEILGEPLLKTGKTMLFGRGDNPINFISIYDVEQFVESALVTSLMDKKIVEVGGPQNLSMRQVVKLFESATGKNVTVRAMPLPMMRLMSVLMLPINPAFARQIQAGIVMDTRNMTFNTTDNNRDYPTISLASFSDVVKRDYVD